MRPTRRLHAGCCDLPIESRIAFGDLYSISHGVPRNLTRESSSLRMATGRHRHLERKGHVLLFVQSVPQHRFTLDLISCCYYKGMFDA